MKKIKVTIRCTASADNWNEDRMDFADYSALRYEIFDDADKSEFDGSFGSADPIAVLDSSKFNVCGVAHVAWGSVYPDGVGGISQIGDGELDLEK
jgi:hypothetical protein